MGGGYQGLACALRHYIHWGGAACVSRSKHLHGLSARKPLEEMEGKLPELKELMIGLNGIDGAAKEALKAAGDKRGMSVDV